MLDGAEILQACSEACDQGGSSAASNANHCTNTSSKALTVEALTWPGRGSGFILNLRREIETLHAASFGWAMSCCRAQRHEAEDVLHAAYVKVLEGRARFDGRSSFRTWLFSVIHRTARERYRRRWLQQSLLERWHQRQPSQPETSAGEAAVAARERNRCLRSALARLSRRQQEVLHLVFYQDLTIEESARALRISLGSARTHFERGKQRLRSILKEDSKR